MERGYTGSTKDGHLVSNGLPRPFTAEARSELILPFLHQFRGNSARSTMSSVTVTTAATTAKSRSIPLRGLGTFQTESGTGIVKASVLSALEIGYRHIDTAFAYGAGDVEKEVGDAIRESGVPRENLFIVSKL